MPDLQALVPRFAGLRVLVIGDIILDHFLWGHASRISPEAPVPVVNVQKEEYLLGGSANVLSNIASLGGKAELCGLIGEDAMGDKVLELLARFQGADKGIIRGTRATTLKTRVLAQGQQVVRIDQEERGTPPSPSLQQLIDFLEHNLHRFDAVMVSDYAKGMVNESTMQTLHRALIRERQLSGRPLPLVVDPKPVNMPLFVGATIITPNHLEAMHMSSLVIRGEENLLAAARAIQEEIDCSAVLITRGEAGMALLEGSAPMVLIPTMAKEVFDVTGAGDTVAATLTLGLASGASMTQAAMLANHAAGVVVGKVGTAAVSVTELLAALAGSQL